jgi:Na+-driven multidrug efflux pump
VIRPRLEPRAEDDPDFRARRLQADMAADALRRRSRLASLLWFCGFQLLGAAIASFAFHTQDEEIGWAVLWLGIFIGDAGSFLTVWWLYLRREQRGDW